MRAGAEDCGKALEFSKQSFRNLVLNVALFVDHAKRGSFFAAFVLEREGGNARARTHQIGGAFALKRSFRRGQNTVVLLEDRAGNRHVECVDTHHFLRDILRHGFAFNFLRDLADNSFCYYWQHQVAPFVDFHLNPFN